MCKMAHFGNCDPETADQEYCIFHKPNKSEEEAVEFYRKFLERFKPRIKKIKVEGKEIKRLVFEKPVDAKGFVFPEVPNIAIKYWDIDGNKWDQRFSFEYAVFEEEGKFSSARFNGRINFAGSTFESYAIFSNATFMDVVYFGHPKKKGTKFKKYSNFKHCVFCQSVDFEKVVFEGNVEFSNSSFHGDVKFHQSKFLGGLAEFLRVNFEGNAFFSEIKFKCGVTFEKSRFKKEAIFTNSLFLSEDCLESGVSANFRLAVFEDISDFSKAEFKGDVIFDKATFGRFATFIRDYESEPKPKFHANVEFSNCDIRQGITLLETNELDSNIAKIEKQFKSLFNLDFPQSIREAARVQRLSFEKEGRREEADKMFILEMRIKREILKKTSKRYLIFEYLPELVLADWVAIYGTKGRRILFWALSVILANGILYFIFSKYLQGFKDPIFGIPIGTIYTNGASEGTPGFLNALYYSLVTFTTLGYGDMHPTGWLKALSALEALTGAVFMALIVAVIARKWMR